MYGSNVMKIPARNTRKRIQIQGFTLVATVLVVVLLGSLLLTSILSDPPVHLSPSLAGTLQEQTGADYEALFERYINEVWNGGNVEVLPELLTEDHQFIYAGNSVENSIQGIADTSARILELRNFGTTFELEMNDILLGEDRLWARLTWKMESFMRDGKEIKSSAEDGLFHLPVLMMIRFRDGKIVETFMQTDPSELVAEDLSQQIIELYNTDAQSPEQTAVYQALFERYIEVWNGNNMDALTQIVAGDHKFVQVDRNIQEGTAVLADWISSFREFASTTTFTVEDMLIDDNQLWASMTVTFESHLALDRDEVTTFNLPALMQVRFQDNKITETHFSLDMTALWQAQIHYVLKQQSFQQDLEDSQIPEAVNTLLTENQNLEATQRIIDTVWNSETIDPEVLQGLYASSFSMWLGWNDETPLSSDTTTIQMMVEGFRAAMPDLRLRVDHIAADGDTVMVSYTAEGTFENDLCINCDGNPVTATHAPTRWKGVFIYTFNGGRVVVERWIMADWAWMEAFGLGKSAQQIMQEERNKETVQDLLDTSWNSEEVSQQALQEIYAPASLLYAGWNQFANYTPALHKSTFDNFQSAFPDLNLRIDDIAADGDKVIVNYVAQGTFENDLHLCIQCGENDVPIAATGEPIIWRGVFIYELDAEGKIEVEWWIVDMGLMVPYFESRVE